MSASSFSRFFDVIITAMLNLTFLRPLVYVSVFLGQDLLVLNGLDFGVVVVLVYLAVDWPVYIFVLCWLHIFMFHCWFDRLHRVLASFLTSNSCTRQGPMICAGHAER